MYSEPGVRQVTNKITGANAAGSRRLHIERCGPPASLSFGVARKEANAAEPNCKTANACPPDGWHRHISPMRRSGCFRPALQRDHLRGCSESQSCSCRRYRLGGRRQDGPSMVNSSLRDVAYILEWS